MDGGAKWTNVTPPQIKPWTRIFNIEAGHFDTLTAYAAANTTAPRRHQSALLAHARRRQDVDGDQQRHRARRGGQLRFAKIRARRGCSTRATDTQVWVSFDDGDHWQSLQLDMPAISVRDLEVKDDSSCLCSDLVAGTHGRGFWILDDVTPLRQAAEVRAAQSARAALPLQAGDGACACASRRTIRRRGRRSCRRARIRRRARFIDYYLAANASGSGEARDPRLRRASVVRSYSSDDLLVRGPDPATDPAAYNKLCQQTPNAADCGLPLYWPAPHSTISTQAGMHRVQLGPALRADLRGSRRTRRRWRRGRCRAAPDLPAVNAPWAPPGAYTVRLTVDGKSYTQPLTLRLDPRVKTPAAALTTLATTDARDVRRRDRRARGKCPGACARGGARQGR